MRYNQALLQATEVRRLERKVLIALQRAMLKLRQKAIRSKQVDLSDLGQLKDELIDAQVAAHLLGIKRTRLNLDQLSLVDDVLKTLRGISQARVNRLKEFYEPTTLRVLSELTTKVNATIRDQIQKSISEQLNTRATVRNIAASLNAAGIVPSNSYYIENIVRTQTQLAYNASRWNEYQKPEFQEILWGYEYVTVGDDRVRESHRKLDGTKLPKDDPFWQTFFPPNGYSCRCQAIPIFEKTRIKRPPADVTPDAGFNFNPGQLLAGIAI